jgi:hypothetical protein
MTRTREQAPERRRDPEAGRLEQEINSGMRRDGIRQRICLHPDTTLTPLGAGELREWLLECDYCPQWIMQADGNGVPRLAAWYWRDDG